MDRNNKSTNLNLGTFNVRGLSNSTKQEQLIDDFERYNLDILCLQETKIKDGGDWIARNGHRMLLFESKSPHYGNGFIIRNSLVPCVQNHYYVSDRICAIQLELNLHNSERQCKVNSITILNVYAPHSGIVKNNAHELEKFYHDLQKELKNLDKNTFLILAGDFNSKVGRKTEEEKELIKCIGSFGKGARNDNGSDLINFCENNRLFLTNTAFDKAARHTTTWVNARRNKEGKTIQYFHQIDFIVCRLSHKHLISNAQSYGGTTTSSDHKIVKTTFKLSPFNLWKRNSKNTTVPSVKKNRSQLITDSNVRSDYQKQLECLLLENDPNHSLSQQWEHLQNSIKKSVSDNLDDVKTHLNPYQPWNKEIQTLSSRQKEIRIQIQNCKNNESKIDELKKERNKILHEIRKKALKVRNDHLDRIVEDIDKSNSDGGMFKAVKILNRKKYEIPIVNDNTGKKVTNPEAIHKIVTDHFEAKFRNEDVADLTPFIGQPRPLTSPITAGEVRKSINRLNNGKSPGEDEICNEYLKVAPAILDQQIANILNKTFETHENIELNNGLMVTLQKPGKPKGPPQNLRPITLLNSTRKVLSTIVLNRIRPIVEEYVSHSQSGFRQNRSTSDVVWTHRWLSAKVLRSRDLQIEISGIDMSAAFDTIDRNELLEILENLIEEDELRIIRYLLSETKINIQINGNETKRPFCSNVGTPQGDSLSPILFIIYLENALKDVRSSLPETSDESVIPSEIIYADDIDFVGENTTDVTEIECILQKHRLKVNVDKTELTHVRKGTEDWKTSKKVGSLLGSKEDIKRRKELSNVALSKLQNIWKRGDKIHQKTKLKLYNSLVKSILLYNCGTWALTKADEDSIDAFHRKQLRKILAIHYPNKISNKKLYTRCQETPLSIQILESRWRLFGHILRRNPNIPANKAMTFYFTFKGKSLKGRPITTLPVTLNNDLKKLQTKARLTTLEDLNILRDQAQNRDGWSSLCREIRRAAEAVQFEDKSEDKDCARL